MSKTNKWAVEYLDKEAPRLTLAQEERILEALNEDYPLEEGVHDEVLAAYGHEARGRDNYIHYGKMLSFELMENMGVRDGIQMHTQFYPTNG